MKKKLVGVIVALLLLMGILIGSIEREVQTAESDITWELNADGSYTFTNHAGKEDCIYAWYVLDENKEVIYKTTYSSDKTFVYDFKNNRELSVKGFVRTGDETDYEQTSISVDANVVLGRVQYEVVSTKMPSQAPDLVEEVIFKYAKRSDAALAEDVLAGEIWDGVDISLPVDWSCKNVENRNDSYRINGLIFLDNLYYEYRQNGDESYIDLIMDYMLDWVENNSLEQMENEWAWHDDATARRMFRMSYYLYSYGDRLTAKEKVAVEKSLREQAQLLMTEEFYTEKHNHGMHQDFGLLVYAFLLGDEERKADYIATALSRTGEYLDWVYTEDGVHKEHSPLYGRDMIADMEILKSLTAEVSPGFSAKMQDTILKSEGYLVQLMKPNGMWPSLGDSPETKVDDILLAENSEYMYWTSNGNAGERPADENVYLEGGYGIMRSSWDDSAEEATWMMLVASTFSSTHKHGDDLSFLLYHKGDLFVEAGKRDYNYSDDMTAWAYSAYAHNVLLVDGKGFPVNVGENGFQSILPGALETGIVDYDFSSDVKSVTGVQKRYENVEQYRTLAYDKANSAVTVADQLEVTEEINATFLYHIAEGIFVEENENGWDLYRDGDLVASIEIKSENNVKLRTVTGTEGEYPYHTWIFAGETEPKRGSLLIVDTTCEAGVNNIEMSIHLK